MKVACARVKPAKNENNDKLVIQAGHIQDSTESKIKNMSNDRRASCSFSDAMNWEMTDDS